MNRKWLVRVLKWTLALAALSFVVWVVPLRDRCALPEDPRVRVFVTQTETACVFHLAAGDVPYERSACATPKCEPGLSSILRRTNPVWIALLIALYFAGTLAWSARWRILLSLANVEVSLWRTWRITLEAQAAGILLPGGVGGDALRIAGVVSPKTPMTLAVASVLLDRVIGLATLAGIAVGLGMGFGGLKLDRLTLTLGAIPLGVLVGLAFLRSDWLGKQSGLLESRPGRMLAPILAYVREPRAPRAILYAVLTSVAVSGMQLLVNRGILFAMGASPTGEHLFFAGIALGYIVAAVPGLPGGWGTQDATLVFFLGQAGVSPGLALGVCLLSRIFWYLSGVVGAILQSLPGGSKSEGAKAS